MRAVFAYLPILSFLLILLSTATAIPVPKRDIDLNNPVQLERSPMDPDNELQRRIVYNPHILTPKAGDVWHADKNHKVTWKTSDIPDELQDGTAEVRLGYLPENGQGGENLRWILAKKVPLTDGSVTFKLPADLRSRNDYIVVLLGDSGNASPKFTITGTHATHKA
ncbi:unnamed protein product [Sympodiomycopsis kandeliae]